MKQRVSVEEHGGKFIAQFLNSVMGRGTKQNLYLQQTRVQMCTAKMYLS